MQIPRALADELLETARSEAPNECCGLVGVDGAAVVAYWPVVNDAASPLRFEMNPRDQLRAFQEIEERGLEVSIFHSHTRSPAYPSQTDVNFAGLWPGATWIIAGVAKGASELRAYAIDGPKVEELDVETV
jgi:proteasome lid subunit RPN8/RPN11